MIVVGQVVMKQITSRNDIAYYLDEIQQAIVAMLGKTGTHGTSAERILSLIATTTGEQGFLLLALREATNGERYHNLVGLLFAVCVMGREPWAEVVALWTEPGFASSIKKEGFELLLQWARSKGVKRIVTIITRSPEKFFRFFHKPLGFEKVGIVAEVKV